MSRRASVTPRRALHNAFRRAWAIARCDPRHGSDDGQALVEFALIFPLFIILVMALIEFSLAFNALLGVNRASENGVLVASEAGNSLGADCMILQEVDNDLTMPNQDSSISTIQVQWTNPSGGIVTAADIWARGGSTTCTLSDGSNLTVPYTETQNSYPDSQRCNIIAGCPALSATHNTVDTIGVQVRYTYTYKTPLGSLLKLLGDNGTPATWTFNKRNVMRIEPVL